MAPPYQRRGRRQEHQAQRWYPEHPVVAQNFLTLQQEALETRNRPSFWTKASKLRQNPVVFVSAGVENPMQELEKELAALEAQNEGTTPTPTPPPATRDSAGMPPLTRAISPIESTSVSDDEPVLLFKGRKTVARQPRAAFKLDAIARELVYLNATSSQAIASDSVPAQRGEPATPDSLMAQGGDSDDGEEGVSGENTEEDEEDEEGGGDEDADIDTDTMARFLGRDIGGSDREFGLSSDQEVPSDADMAFPVGGERPRRLKKAERKKWAAQGLLPKRSTKSGGKDKSHDLWTKYPDSMTITEVVHEIRLFLIHSQEL
jgi:hypothetical protein